MERIEQIISPDYFAKLCKALLVAEYKDFQTIDDSGGDAGNDGYSESNQMLFQLYCPEKPNKVTNQDYKTKVKKDLEKAKKLFDSGKYKIKEWIFVTPNQLQEEVQTFIRNEAEKKGFAGIAWSSPKLTDLFTKNKHLRSEFPDLINADIEQGIGSIVEHLESKNEIEKKYKTKNELRYKKRIDDARDVLNAGKYESAKKSYEEIIKDLEEDTDQIDKFLFFRAYNNLGNCELNLENLSRAAELFEKGYENAPQEPKAIMNYALAKGLKKSPEEGLEIINKLLQENPDDKHAISVKADLLSSLSRYDELTAFLKEKGKMGLAHIYTGLNLLNQKKYDEAYLSFEKGIELNPKEIRPYLLGVQAIMVGTKEKVRENAFPSNKIPPEIKQKFDKAITWLKEVIKLSEGMENKNDLEMAYTNIAGCYVAISLFKESIEMSQKASSINPQSPIPYLNKGVSELKLGLNKEAIASLQKFKDLGGIDEVDRHIAYCSLRIGDLDAAEKFIEEQLQSEKLFEDLDIASLAVELYSRRLNNEKVEYILKKLETDFSSNPQALRIRAEHLQRLGMTGADKLLQKALENSNTPSEKFLTEIEMADLLYNLKDYKAAADIYEKYLDTTQSNPPTLRYAESLYNSGQYGKLLRWIESLELPLRKNDVIRQLEGYSNLYLNNLEKSSVIFRELFEKNSNNLQYLTTYGMCNFRLGKNKEAKDAYDRVKNRITEPEDLIMLASGYEFIGDRNIALDLTFKALESDPNSPKTHLAYIFTFLRREQGGETDFEEKYVKLFQKSIGEFSKRFPEEKALQSFEIKDNDISGMLEVVDQVSETTGTATELYKESKAPLAFIPKFTHKKPFDVWAAFTNMPDVGIKIAFGSPEEISADNTTAEEHQNDSVVIDIYPLFLLGYLDNLELLTKSFKKIHVHQSVVDELTETIDDLKVSAQKGISSLAKIDGKHRMTEIPAEHVQKTLKILERIKDFVTKNNNFKIQGFSKENTEKEREVIDMLDDSTKNSVLLAEELSFPLYVDDRILRTILRNEFGIKSFSTQSLINTAQKNGMLSLEERYTLQENLINLNYDFVPIDANFIYAQFKKTGYNVDFISKIISVLGKKETSIQSLATVLSDLIFLLMIDKTFRGVPRMEAIQRIISEVTKNHDVKLLEEGVFSNLQNRFRPERHQKLKEIIMVFFG